MVKQARVFDLITLKILHKNKSFPRLHFSHLSLLPVADMAPQAVIDGAMFSSVFCCFLMCFKDKEFEIE